MSGHTGAWLATDSPRIALHDFGITQARLTQLASRHNDVYRVTLASGKNYLLRLQNDLMSDAQAASQLLWLEALLRESNVRVPAPIRTADGRPFTHVGARSGRRRAVLLRWLPGKIDQTRSDAVYCSAVELIAQMHRHAETFRPGGGFSCRPLDGKWLFNDRFFLRSAAARDHVSASGRKMMRAAEQMVLGTMEILGKHPRRFGLIHADLNLDNILFYRGRASPIDFDEFGRGWYLFDLAELIRTSVTPDNWRERKQLAIGAYQGFRALDDVEVAAFDAFIVATFVQYLNWAFLHARGASDLKWVGFCIEVLGKIAHHAKASGIVVQWLAPPHRPRGRDPHDHHLRRGRTRDGVAGARTCVA